MRLFVVPRVVTETARAPSRRVRTLPYHPTESMDAIRLVSAWLVGIALGDRWPLPVPWLLTAAVGAAVPAWRMRRRSVVALPATMCACALLGAARQASTAPVLHDGHVASYNDGGTIVLRGRIVAEPDRRDWGVQYRIAVAAVQDGGAWGPAHGIVLAQAARHPLHAYGAEVQLRARLQTPPVFDTFDYRAWLAQRDVHSIARRARIDTVACCRGSPIRRVLLAIKDRGRGALAASLPEPEASLATGILLGDARGIPRRVDDAFRATNTTHVIAISGSNVALLLAVSMAALGRMLGRRRAVPPCLVMLGLYTALVGADAAVVRAAVMGSVMLVGHYLGRPGDAATALMLAAGAMTMYRPGYVWDLGFQLSFAATVGLLLFTSRWSAGVEAALAARLGATRARPAAALIADAVLVTLAAQMTTWPVIAHQVGQVSVAGLGANFLIVPAQGVVMALGGVTAIAGSLWPPAGAALGALAWLPLAYTIRVVEATARLPLASVSWPMPFAAVVAYYAALAVVAVPTNRARIAGTARRAAAAGPRARWAALPAAAAAFVLVWAAALGQPDGLLHLHVLDVGQGDALWIVTPNGRRVLVDGGPSPSAVLDGIGRRLPPWDRRIDVVVLTHPDADHVGGLPAVLQRYRVGLIVQPPGTTNTPDAAAWRESLAREGADTVVAAAGATILIDRAPDVAAEVLWPPAGYAPAEDEGANNRSVVLRIAHGRTSFLLTGDIETAVEDALLTGGRPLGSTVLKVAHHGSSTSTSPGFVRAVAPWLALVSVGADNTFGHPDPDVLTRLAPAALRRTDVHGTIHVISDGADVWLR